jgi:kanamycin nucleotidyltransferase
MRGRDRARLAEDLCARVVDKYGDGIILGGVYGSTARGTDTTWSDLEMLFITRDECGARGQHFLFRDIAISYMVLPRSRLEELLADPSVEGVCGWSFYMGVLSILKVLHGQAHEVEAWLDIGRNVPETRFREALEGRLPGLITESYGRIHSCRARGNRDDWHCAVLEVLFEMREALCLLNRTWVTHDYLQGMEDTFRFPTLPRRYEQIVPALWRARDLEEALPLAVELVENFWRLMDEEGIKVRRYDIVSDIPV